MILSASVTDKIKRALAADDGEEIDTIVIDASRFKGKHARALMQRTVNSVIVEYALRENKPELLLTLHDIPEEGAEDLFSLILRHYITTRDSTMVCCDSRTPEKTREKKFAIADNCLYRSDAHLNGYLRIGSNVYRTGIISTE